MCNDRFRNESRCCRNEWFDSEPLREEALMFDREAENFAFRRNCGCCWDRSFNCCCPVRNNCWFNRKFE